MAQLQRRIGAGAGLFIEVLGFFTLFFFFPWGIIIGIVFMLTGARMRRGWRCGKCGNPVADKYVRMCPTCKVSFE